MTAGYSGKPLAAKLGIRPGDRVALLDLPSDLTIELPEGADACPSLGGTFDLIVSFQGSRAGLDAAVPDLLAALDKDGALWMAWPKRASGVATDLTEDVMREVWLPRGLVDTKVCAIDEIWSGLRFSWRRELRHRVTPGQSSEHRNADMPASFFEAVSDLM